MFWISSITWNKEDIDLAELQAKYRERLLPLYAQDRFVFCEHPLYESMSKKAKSNVKSYVLDYRECLNPNLRLEAKFYFQCKLEIQKIKLRTAGTLHCHLKHYFNFMNTCHPSVSSIFQLDVDRFRSEYCAFYAEHFGDPYSKVYHVDKNMKKHEYHHIRGEVSRITRMAESLMEFLYDGERKFTIQADIWDIRDTPYKDKIPAYRPRYTINFNPIEQRAIRTAAKQYIYHKLAIRSFATCQDYLKAICLFSEFLSEVHPEIQRMAELTRSVIEEFFRYIREGNRFNTRTRGYRIGKLRDFFDTCILLNLSDKPTMRLIIDADYCTHKKALPQFLTDEELMSLNQYVHELPLVIARMLFTIETVGMRISELCTLRLDCISTDEDGNPVLTYYQHKTKKMNRIPISDVLRQCLESQISDVRAQYGEETQYMFPQTATVPVSVETFQRHINLLSYNNKILNRAGRPLRIKTHSFRATVATNYMNIGIDPNVVRMLIGQADIRSLKYYFETSQEKVIDAYSPMLEDQDKLIRSIGDPDAVARAFQEKVATKPLCNGMCCKQGDCEHFNACYSCAAFRPDKSLMSLYQHQLLEAEQALAAARINGLTRMEELNESLCQQLRKIIQKCEV